MAFRDGLCRLGRYPKSGFNPDASSAPGLIGDSHASMAAHEFLPGWQSG
jgi:hypothetical protein